MGCASLSLFLCLRNPFNACNQKGLASVYRPIVKVFVYHNRRTKLLLTLLSLFFFFSSFLPSLPSLPSLELINSHTSTLIRTFLLLILFCHSPILLFSFPLPLSSFPPFSFPPVPYPHLYSSTASPIRTHARILLEAHFPPPLLPLLYPSHDVNTRE